MTRRIPLGLVLSLVLLASASAEAQVKPRIVIAFDTSGSMAQDLNGQPTFGDGVTDNCSGAGTNASPYCGDNCTAGMDTDCDGEPNDSRIYVAKEALRNMISAFGDVDWALARFSQNQGVDLSCLRIDEGGPGGTGFECNTTPLGTVYLTSYGNPQCNSENNIPTSAGGNCPYNWPAGGGSIPGIPVACRPGSGGRPTMQTWQTGDPDVCTNYQGTCSGGNVLVGFSDMGAFTGMDNTLGIYSWLDNTETNFVNTTTVGNFCNSATTGDCELRPEGATPLAGLLTAAQSYIVPIRTADSARTCRPYSVILLTDGAETCGGNPVSAATTLRANGILTYVIGLDISGASTISQLNSIATAGGTDAGAPGGDTAYFANDPVTLATGLSAIVADSLLIETCNGIDDDCDTFIDEGVTNSCGTCGATPTESCNGTDDDCDGSTDEGVANACGTCGPTPVEVCNGLDDDCDGAIDDGLSCGSCVPEICDGIDNDCDTRIDEGVSRACGTDVGRCTAGTQICTGGAGGTWGPCSGVGPRTETCNNIDDDCDGVIDGISRSCGTDVGACSSGSQLCTAGAYGTCVGAVGPMGEICDSADNDCDGSTDEGNPGGGAACGSSTGICTRGMSMCSGGMLVCSGGTPPGTETCNGLDDDCDGLTDEGLPSMGACGMSSVGECMDGMRLCSGGMYRCVGARGPSPELCDGADNDCDGMTDEGNPEAGLPCGDDTGECTAGSTVCTAGTLSCMGGTGPTMEICDGLDNDCDGVPDEGLGVGAPCGSDVGECSPGVNICEMGALVCTGEIGPATETCNLLDDDCDGAIDEVSLGGPCGSDEGLCMAGMEQCIGGALVCMGAVDPTTETCDCSDNDCDGATDEGGGICPAGTACVDCSCADPCVRSEFGFTCPTGTTPQEQADGSCYCVQPRCDEAECGAQTISRDGADLCTPDSTQVANCVCKNNDCTFACEGVVCAPGLCCNPRDELGRCVECNCRGLGCPSGEVCNRVTAECEADACEGVSCGAGQACRDGACEESCATTMCASDETCSGGVCVDDMCAGVSCGATQYCDPDTGTCVDDPCRGVSCPPGTVCDSEAGGCIDDPCNRLHCPDGQVCVDGECALGGPGPDGGTDGGGADGGADTGTPGDEFTRILATGGGGCTCSVPGAETAGGDSSGSRTGALSLLFGLLGLGAWRRRRKGGLVTAAAAKKAAAVTLLAVLTLFLGGCDVDPYCLDCVDGEVDTGTVDTGVVDSGMRDSRPADTAVDTSVDTGPDGCVPGAVELCNEFDDDCDGMVDEGVDTETDVANCGSCGNACIPANAFPTCTAGVCGLGSCRTGFYDLDGDDSNGCEYRCSTLDPAADDSACDLRDNDCDGTVDEDVDFTTDPMNCGTCGTICRFAHAAGACTASACVLGACDPGFYNIDGRMGNGCEYACTPSTSGVEACNAVDDDCDGMTDEGNPDGGATCGTNVGECNTGVQRCVGGALVCSDRSATDRHVEPTTELCNGLDDDCDGTVDQGNPEGGALCGSGVGACVRGRQTCSAGTLVCMGGVGPTTELCNGQDDDCDGTIDDGNPEGGGVCGTSAGICMSGSFMCTGGSLQCVGATGPALDVCDGMDNDCDMSVDEDFNLMTDVRNCGMCGRMCNLANATEGCSGGSCVVLSCDDGFVDLDGNPMNGCEYTCSIAGSEVCNGRDDDCDGMVDDGVMAPAFFCNANGECAGTTATCMGTSGWVCNYSDPDYEPSEVSCDGLDNDCDGAVDEPFPTKGDACGNGIGLCRRTGMIVCNSAGTGVTCNAPPAGTGMASELCNNIDDDCDGTTDENIPVANIPTVDLGGGVLVMQYEASRPDATSTAAGTVGTRACSNPNVLPWTNVSWTEARNACLALNTGGVTGWGLCNETDWENACEGPGGPFCTWSYATSCTTSSPTTCNGQEYNPDRMFPTASTTFGSCYTDWSGSVVYDMSGNVKEWTNTAVSSGVHVIRGGSYNNIEPGRTCTFDFTVGNNSFRFPNTGFRCCKY